MNKEKNSDWKGSDRRRHRRIKKNFILSYFEKTNPQEKFELTQLKDIGKGGLRFITTRKFAPGTLLGIELKTPYISETTYLEGEVLDCIEKVKNMIYETRLQFTLLNTQAEFILNKLIEYFENKENSL